MTPAMRVLKYWGLGAVLGAWFAPGGLPSALLAEVPTNRPYGLESRPLAKAYLGMPAHAEDRIPARISETGLFKDVRRMLPVDELIPYDLVVPFWSDHAAKFRWISVPTGEAIQYSRTGEWIFPVGTVFVKSFELTTDETRPGTARRLETRVLVRDESGGVYGVTYKWRPDNSDADLMDSNLTETVTIKTAAGERSQPWYYPNREDCRTCHTSLAGFVLGVKTRQLNRDLGFPSGVADNQLRAWNHAGMFTAKLAESDVANAPKLVRLDDPAHTLEERARSYLDANCAHCHRPGGTVADFDLRFDTPLARQKVVGAPVLIDQGIDHARVIAPNDIWRSILFMRTNTVEAFKMPPLARNTVDESGMALLRAWIESLPGQPVLPPPEFSPRGGSFERAVNVSLKTEAGATIRYTLDGSNPTASDPVYEKPIPLTGPTIFRARSYRVGSVESIPAQEIFIVSE